MNVLSSPYDHTLCPNKLASSFRVILPSIKLIIKMYYAWLVHNFSKDYWYFKDSKTGYRINALDLSGFFGPKLISDANKWEFFNQSSKVIRKWISSETDEDDLKWLRRPYFPFHDSNLSLFSPQILPYKIICELDLNKKIHKFNLFSFFFVSLIKLISRQV